VERVRAYAPLRNPSSAIGLPAGIQLQPTILVRNETAHPVPAELALKWRSDSGEGSVKLPAFQLAPFATQQFQIGAMEKQLGIPEGAHWALVALSSSGPEQLAALAATYDISGRYMLQTPFSSHPAGHYAGGEWRIDSNHNQIISVTNSEQKPAEAALSLHYDNGRRTYEMRQTIQPGDQMWVNLAELTRDRVPDSRGNILAADASYGTYDVREWDNVRGGLILGALALDNTYGSHVRHQYANCCGYEGIFWDPDEFVFLFDSGADPGAIVGSDACTGEQEDISFDFTDWFSSDSSVAKVTTKLVTPEAAGQATATAEGDVYIGVGGYCAYDPEEPTASVVVQVPTSLKVLKTTILQTGNSGNHGCLSGYYGIEVDVDYQVLDQYGTAIQSSRMTPQEYIVWYNGTNNGGFTDIGPTYINTTSATTRSDGSFDDAPVGLVQLSSVHEPSDQYADDSGAAKWQPL
jgi:hypothetical protein